MKENKKVEDFIPIVKITSEQAQVNSNFRRMSVYRTHMTNSLNFHTKMEKK